MTFEHDAIVTHHMSFTTYGRLLRLSCNLLLQARKHFSHNARSSHSWNSVMVRDSSQRTDTSGKREGSHCQADAPSYGASDSNVTRVSIQLSAATRYSRPYSSSSIGPSIIVCKEICEVSARTSSKT